MTAQLHKDRRRRRYLGFSLIELLIVISIIMIIMLFALPKVREHTIQIHETSAMNSIDTIRKEQMVYASRFPSKGYACSLAALGPPPPGQPSSDSASGLIPGDLANGSKDGYNFSISDCATQQNTQTVVSYWIVAVPAVPGSTGNSAFCSDGDEIKTDHSGNGQSCVTGGAATH